MTTKKSLPEQLIGSWRLVEAVTLGPADEIVAQPYGPEPLGQLILTSGGRMLVAISDSRNSMPEGERRRFISYCGNFSVEANRFMTEVDGASFRSGRGSIQIRTFELNGDRLIFWPPSEPDGIQRRLTWQRMPG